MYKARKTRKEKIKIETKRQMPQEFKVKSEWLNLSSKKVAAQMVLEGEDKKYFRLDLTKTFFLTMLVLALELALWQYLSRH